MKRDKHFKNSLYTLTRHTSHEESVGSKININVSHVKGRISILISTIEINLTQK